MFYFKIHISIGDAAIQKIFKSVGLIPKGHTN